MKSLIRLSIALSALFLGHFCYAGELIADSSTWAENYTKTTSNIEKPLTQEEKTEQKIESERKAKLLKEMNAILVDWYKSKLNRVFSSLEENVKDEPKEYKIKIYYNLLSSINSRIDVLNSKKIDISDNKKKMLNEILGFIKDYAKGKIEDVAKEK